MTADVTRRTALGLIAATSAFPALANDDPRLGDIVIGDENAPITVIEYASFTCPHCGTFHKSTWPEFKANYVDTGKVRFILREVYFDQWGLMASAVSRCGGKAGFYPMADQFLKNQDQWASGIPQDQRANEIAKIGRINGLSGQAVDACMTDNTYHRALYDGWLANQAADQIESTPTFIINGEKVSGAYPYDEFAELVDSHL